MNADRCNELVQPRRSAGIMSRGTESFLPGSFRQCSRRAAEGDTKCAVHVAQRDRIRRANILRRAAEAGVKLDLD